MLYRRGSKLTDPNTKQKKVREAQARWRAKKSAADLAEFQERQRELRKAANARAKARNRERYLQTRREYRRKYRAKKKEENPEEYKARIAKYATTRILKLKMEDPVGFKERETERKRKYRQRQMMETGKMVEKEIAQKNEKDDSHESEGKSQDTLDRLEELIPDQTYS